MIYLVLMNKHIMILKSQNNKNANVINLNVFKNTAFVFKKEIFVKIVIA
jgi:hypothetical protein